ncbi:MAG: ABC transporter permease, partial [Kiritimatiellia bacterium]
MSAWYRDPLLVKEFRTHLRARTATVVVLLQSLVLCVMAGLFFLSHYGSPAWEVGERLFQVLLYVQTMILFFLAPLVAASVISGEKEQKTYDSLLVTPASPSRIILTKLASALAVFVVLLAIALPFAVAAYLLGGVPFRLLALGWCYILLLMSVSAATGVYWSTRFDRSIASIPAAAICT